MEFNPHKMYDGVPVNTQHSIVHVPTNVYDKGKHKECLFLQGKVK